MSRSKPIKADNIEFYRILSINIRYFREAAGMQPRELASKADISQSYLTTLESPARWDEHPSLEVLFDISKALNIHPSALLKDLTKNAETSGSESTYDLFLLPRNERIADDEEWLYETKLGDVIDRFKDNGYAFIRFCMRHFDHRRRSEMDQDCDRMW